MSPSSPPPQAAPQGSSSSTRFLRYARALYRAFGFNQGYAFTLWFIFGGAMTGFVLARIQTLSLTSRMCPANFPAPSDPESANVVGIASTCYWISRFVRYRAGMGLHLATSFPAGVLAVVQFVPKIRHCCILYHRVAGYVAVVLMTAGNVGAMMLADTAMGGDLTTQTFVGVVALGILLTFSFAIYNIRHLQLDQHRAWMLRSWFYCGFIIPMRLIQGVMAAVVMRWPTATRHTLMTCSQLLYMYGNDAETLHEAFPVCASANAHVLAAAGGFVPVRGALGADQAQNSATWEMTFTAAGILALLINAVGVEAYLWATRAEARRLRAVSAQMQKDRGVKPSRFADKAENDDVHQSQLGNGREGDTMEAKQDSIVHVV